MVTASLQRIASRMAHIEPFEVMEIQSLARQVEAQGHDVIHLEIGEPDFRTPQPIVDAAKRALDNEKMYYTSALGLPALREAISGFYRTRYGVEVPASRIIVTAGSSAALLLAFGVVLDAGDEVLTQVGREVSVALVTEDLRGAEDRGRVDVVTLREFS